MKLNTIERLEGTIKLRTGLHIGSGDAEMRIGGTDNPIVRHPHTREPYIPGSSLKGKVRSLLELRSGALQDGQPLSAKRWRQLRDADDSRAGEVEQILKLFGSSGAEDHPFGPTRASFADCFLRKEWLDKANLNQWALSELKSENTIDRIRGVAENPRTTERVVAGAEFEFSISLRVFEGDDRDAMIHKLLQGLRLLELDALGGSGSRGYGRVEISFDTSPGLQQQFEAVKP